MRIVRGVVGEFVELKLLVIEGGCQCGSGGFNCGPKRVPSAVPPLDLPRVRQLGPAHRPATTDPHTVVSHSTLQSDHPTTTFPTYLLINPATLPLPRLTLSPIGLVSDAEEAELGLPW